MTFESLLPIGWKNLKAIFKNTTVFELTINGESFFNGPTTTHTKLKS